MSFPVPNSLVVVSQPVRRSVRRLRWFKASFRDQLKAISADTGVVYSINESALTACFVDWLRMFDAQRPATLSARRAYVGFAAGLMLQSLIRHKPLAVERLPGQTDLSNPAFFWPEGYMYVAYCLNIRTAVLEQDFDEFKHVAPELKQIRVWWSFKENSDEDASLAIAFLDLFSGEEPNWQMPSLFNESQVQLVAPKFYEQRKLTDG
jgi:hypothetical protein